MDSITSNSKHIRVNGHSGTWYVVDEATYSKGKTKLRVFLLEHETYGDMAPCIIVDDHANIVMEDVYNGFLDLEDNGWRKEGCNGKTV